MNSQDKHNNKEEKDSTSSDWEVKKEGVTEIITPSKKVWRCPSCGKEYWNRWDTKCLKCHIPLVKVAEESNSQISAKRISTKKLTILVILAITLFILFTTLIFLYMNNYHKTKITLTAKQQKNRLKAININEKVQDPFIESTTQKEIMTQTRIGENYEHKETSKKDSFMEWVDEDGTVHRKEFQ